jgi:hypothetical protein
MPVNFDLSELWTYDPEDATTRKPIPTMREARGHIHGRLAFLVNEKLVPQLGYFGPDDVCLAEWLCELKQARDTLASSDPSAYEYDEGEQGQPRYLFQREGDQFYLSLVDSKIDGKADPDWQRVRAGFQEFTDAVDSLLARAFDEILRQQPAHGEAWWNWAVDRSGDWA